MNKLKMMLLARFIPHRTAIGLGLLVVTEGARIVLGSDLCTAATGPNPICDGAAKVLATVGPWLLIMGVADQKRKD